MVHTSVANDEIAFAGATAFITNSRAIIGPPGCGKTSARLTLEAASKYIGGHASSDSSEIMDWHLNPTNKSPYFDTAVKAQHDRQAGRLVDNKVIYDLIHYRFKVQKQELLISQEIDLKQMDISGFPRNQAQGEMMPGLFMDWKIYAILISQEEANKNRLKRIAMGVQRDDDTENRFLDRWADYHRYTEPFIQSGIADGSIIPIEFGLTHRAKVHKIIHHGNYTDAQKASMKHQLHNKRCDAFWLARKYDSPDSYKRHMLLTLQLYRNGESSIAQLFLALAFAKENNISLN